MHTVHHTKAVVIKSQPSGEANKLFWLFTRDHGLVVALATGVRLAGAKLKGQTRDYTVLDVDLVQGREVWRLVSAVHDIDPLKETLREPIARSYIRNLATLERFVTEENPHPELFAHILECAMVAEYKALDQKVVRAYDAIGIWRTLIHLGYIAVDDKDSGLFTDPILHVALQLSTEKLKQLVKVVTEAIKETHL